MKNKHPKMDPRRISDQDWELDLVAGKFRVSRQDVRDAKKAIGTDSRHKVYKYLREHFLLDEITE